MVLPMTQFAVALRSANMTSTFTSAKGHTEVTASAKDRIGKSRHAFPSACERKLCSTFKQRTRRVLHISLSASPLLRAIASFANR